MLGFSPEWRNYVTILHTVHDNFLRIAWPGLAAKEPKDRKEVEQEAGQGAGFCNIGQHDHVGRTA